MAPGILKTMVILLWQYLRYWWNKVNLSSTRITLDRLYNVNAISHWQYLTGKIACLPSHVLSCAYSTSLVFRYSQSSDYGEEKIMHSLILSRRHRKQAHLYCPCIALQEMCPIVSRWLPQNWIGLDLIWLDLTGLDLAWCILLTP